MSLYDVVIVGAGPVGGALACRLAAAGRQVLLVDRAALPPMEHPAFDGRAYAIAAGSRRLLDEAGLWEALPYAPCPILDIEVTDGKVGRAASPLKLHFGHEAVGPDPFGWIVEARSLRMAINRRLYELANLTVHAPADAAVTRHPTHAEIGLGGATVRARLVVAADGRDSPLRRQARIPTARIPYAQAAIVCAVAHEHPHRGVAVEHFLPHGPFAQLPMSGTADFPNLSAIVFTERRDIAERLHALPDDAFTEELRRRAAPSLGHIRLVGRRWRYPLSAMHAARYTAPRLALVGDAAHGIHPIAGQGLNLGLRDAMALAALIDEADDPGGSDILVRYQAARRPANLLMLGATHGLDRLFATDNPAIRLARDIGLAAVNRMPRLKQRFMLAAMGR